MIALQGAVFNLQFEISYKLQDIEFQVERLISYRNGLVKIMSEKVKELPRDNFAVKQHLKYVDLYSSEQNYQSVTYEDTLIVREEVAPLILPDDEDVSAVRFDALIYGIELAYLMGKKYTRARGDLLKRVNGIAKVANIPDIQKQTDFINKLLNTDYLDNAGINEFEEIREKLRDLMKYIPIVSGFSYDTNFQDELLEQNWNESELENDELKNYKAKAEFYIKQHQDNIVIAKLKTNKPLTGADVEALEEILWKEVGTKQDYENEFGTKPLGEFVREIVGLDMNAAKEAFSEYLNGNSLDSRQIYFVNQIIEYIVHNGMLKDFSVLQEPPFTNQGSVVEVFTDLNVWNGIRKVIDSINANAAA
jgi:type I restriction enzyme R subunit